MSTPPADPPPLVPDPAADVAAAQASGPPHPAPAGVRPPGTDWTTSREVALECAGCGLRFVLAYKYRFVEGLAATQVRCPAPSCRHPREYYLPVNAFDVTVGPGGGPSPLRS